MKYLIITGGSGGIGNKTIELFLKNKWSIINISRTKCNIDGVLNYKADLSLIGWEKDILPSIKEIIIDATQISLVHNAFKHQHDRIDNLKVDEIRIASEVNIISPVILNQYFVPYMSQGSSILYMGSTLSEKAVANCASYVISKHAVVGMMRATCQDLKDMKIHTACICPGFTDTKMLREQINYKEEVLKKIIKSKVTFNRLISPEEIADLVFYCSNNQVINGSVIHANLGQIEN